MKKRIYYTVDVEFYDDDYELGTTGNKTINAYDIESSDGIPQVVPFFNVASNLSEISVEVMQNWLEDNGYGDQEFDFQML